MTTQDQIEVMQAFVEGKEIEYRTNSAPGGVWFRSISPEWNWEYRTYRIKPEPPRPKVRPYKDAEELMGAIKVHGSWVKDRNGNYYNIGIISSREGKLLIGASEQDWYLENVAFADGTPFGVEEGGSNG